MANINGMLPGKHIKAADLQGRRVTAVMALVKQEKVGEDQKPVLYFQGKERGLVLNKTNANTISEVYGPETDHWAGQPIVLFEAMVDFQGKTVQAIRVQVPQGGAQQPPQHHQQAFQPGGQPGYAPAPGYQAPPQQNGGYGARPAAGNVQTGANFRQEIADEIPF